MAASQGGFSSMKVVTTTTATPAAAATTTAATSKIIPVVNFVIKHYAMKAYGGVEVQLHSV
jgi:hypothetical protein